MSRGNNYINKHFFALDDGWTVDAVNAKLEEMGLRIHREQNDFRPEAFDRYETRPGHNLMIYTHRTKDDPAEVRRAFVNELDSEWYTTRGWERIEAGKMEMPY
ncbi:MAG: hypothetical protein ACRC6V_01275 [Bacteroidales bacterium]